MLMRHFLLFCLLLIAHFATAQSDYYIKFPDDIVTTVCLGTPPVTPPQLSNTHGANITIDYTDEVFTIVPDACIKIERIWYVKSASYDPGLPCTYVPNPQPNAVINNPANWLGPVVSPAGTPAPWEPTVVKTYPSAPDATDFSTFWSDTANCYQYKQTIKITDNAEPVVLNCPAAPLFFEDGTPNNPQLWNASYWLDPLLQTNDLGDAPVSLSITATDACHNNDLMVRYLLFLDLDGDGAMETTVNSLNPPAAGQVNVGNTQNPNFAGGTPQDFDQRTLAENQKYRFGIQTTSTDSTITATVGWNTAQEPGAWTLPQLPVGTHKVKWMIGDNCGNEQVCEYVFTVLYNPVTVHTIRGKVVEDNNSDCEATPGEPVLYNWKVQLDRFNPGGSLHSTQYGSVGADGSYYFQVGEGEYRVAALPPNDYFSPCSDHTWTISTLGDTTELDFPTFFLVECPFLETDIGTPWLRRCFDNTYTVRYCNTGTAAAENVFVRVKLDPFQSFVSASQTAVFEGNDTWRFDLGQIPMNDCGSFTLVAYLDCDSTVIGQTHCVEAHIYPDSFCIIPNAWSGANVDVNGACHPDSVRFVLRNTGPAPTSLLEYIVIEDNIITRQAPFQLPAGDSMYINVPANGSTWRVQAEQEPGNPYNPMPSATIEACGQNPAGEFSIGFVPQFDEDDGDPFISIDCQISRGSYDPNDKQGFPLGYGAAHLIEPGQSLDYFIRFQNTGTDTAFTVVVVDTLSAWLDPASIVPGASSHPYRFVLSEAGILAFHFDNILLPDSNVNEVASHGFIKFRVQQRDSIPLGTVVTNRAAIYFDFNPPVFTNETYHQVGENFVPSGTHDWAVKAAAIRVSPNPVSGNDVLRFENLSVSNGRFDLYDGRGQFVLTRSFSDDRVSLEPAHLPTGLYFFKIFEGGKMRGAGKVVVR